MRTKNGDRIYDILRSHIGKENAISAPAIAQALRWPEHRERKVRQIIRDESMFWAANGGLVCAIPGSGYFIAQSFEELAAYESWLTEGRDSYSQRIAIVRKYCRARGFNLSNRSLTTNN